MGGLECFKNFFAAKDAKMIEFTPLTMRALFFICIDASPLFSGLGLGYNNVASPLTDDMSFEDHYTGREFISPNLPLSGVTQVTDLLPDITADDNVDFLAKGFWSGLDDDSSSLLATQVIPSSKLGGESRFMFGKMTAEVKGFEAVPM